MKWKWKFSTIFGTLRICHLFWLKMELQNITVYWSLCSNMFTYLPVLVGSGESISQWRISSLTSEELSRRIAKFPRNAFCLNIATGFIKTEQMASLIHYFNRRKEKMLWRKIFWCDYNDGRQANNLRLSPCSASCEKKKHHRRKD